MDKVEKLSMEQAVVKATQNKANVELLCDVRQDGIVEYGVRLRFWSKDLKNQMVLGEGDTFLSAMENAMAKARAGRLEPLDFAKRPWHAPVVGEYGAW